MNSGDLPRPNIHPDTYIAAEAHVSGAVTLEKGVSVWPCAVLRGDFSSITVGKNTNIQDNATLHGKLTLGVTVGRDVTIGHNAVVHGCEIGDRTLIGIGSIVLDGARVGADCIVAAGCVVPPGMQVPDGSVVMGVPGKVVRSVREEERRSNLHTVETYLEMAKRWKAALNPR